MSSLVTGRSLGLQCCPLCRLTVRARAGIAARCPRCGGRLHVRKPASLANTGALVLSAAILYLPANLVPVMHTHQLLSDDDDTIMSGVISLATSGSWPLAIIVFFASIVVPLLKLVALGDLLIAVRRGRVRHVRERSRLFRLVEFVGRWSMIDVFALSLLTALVKVPSLADIRPRPGALAFAAVVVLTMLAVQSFDERLLWDAAAAQAAPADGTCADPPPGAVGPAGGIAGDGAHG
jgi:paraquat-inducible protein A